MEIWHDLLDVHVEACSDHVSYQGTSRENLSESKLVTSDKVQEPESTG